MPDGVAWGRRWWWGGVRSGGGGVVLGGVFFKRQQAALHLPTAPSGSGLKAGWEEGFTMAGQRTGWGGGGWLGRGLEVGWEGGAQALEISVCASELLSGRRRVVVVGREGVGQVVGVWGAGGSGRGPATAGNSPVSHGPKKKKRKSKASGGRADRKSRNSSQRP